MRVSLFSVVLAAALFGTTLAHAQADGEAPAAPVPSQSEAGDEEEEEQSRGSLWAPLFAGGAACVALDVVGCGLSSVGCLLSQVTPSGGDNCLEDCVIGIVTAGVVLLGVLAASVGLFVLGPLAALVVTAAATIASAIAGRAFWGASLGGLPGIALGAGGLVTAALGLMQMDIGASGGLQPGLFSGDPSSNLALAGFGMAALAGVVALAGALAGDTLFTSLLAKEEPAAPRDSSLPPSREEMPLALAPLGSAPLPY